jgi:CheY-like chemotaxis protein
MKVLVVEDDPRISDVLEYALKADGYEVVKAQRGREAIELAKRSAPELIVLDIGLPDIDGFEVCREVRKSSDAPIIFLTSRSDEIEGRHFVRLGAIAQFAYMILFSYSFFFEGLTGLTITIGAIVTLALLMAATARVNWADKFGSKNASSETPPPLPQVPA